MSLFNEVEKNALDKAPAYLTRQSSASGSGGGFWSTATPVFGGISPKDARQIYDQMRAETLGKKNLWRIDVSSDLDDGAYDMPERFNLFALDVEFSAFTIQGDKVKIGAAAIDFVDSGEPLEVRITTLDDSKGTLKRWFEKHYRSATADDGTVMEPGRYAVKLCIAHGWINPEDEPNHFEVKGYFRPQSIDLSLSRREDALEELSMTFSQLDTFMRP